MSAASRLRYCADDDERREIARTLNADRRQLTEEQRRAVVEDLRKEGHSVRAIAGALGVGKSTVARDLDTVREIVPSGTIEPDRVVRQGGGSYPTRRPQVLARDPREQERAQLALLAAAAAELERRAVPSGPLSVEQACEALGEIGRGLAAVVDVLDGRLDGYVPGPALTWYAQGPADGSLLDGVARALCGAPIGGAPP